jgi:SpoVK/Ycf46/Vps4 family AAA+-type ATPase
MNDEIRIDPSQIIDLLDAALAADHVRVRRIASVVAQLCLEQGDENTAKRLRGYIRRRGVPLQTSGIQAALPVDGVSRLPLIDEETWPTVPAILNQQSAEVANRFIEDIRNATMLFESGILTRFGLMLSGPPGTGKTLLAGHIAAQLGRPFYVARLDSLISSRLGDTAKNIRQIFDFIPAKGGVLLLDELDAIAKMRDDRHELGELKRVVNTVIQGLDSLDDQAVVIAATNHPQLLDAAIWRRFPYRCDMGLPDIDARAALWRHFLYTEDRGKDRHAQILAQLTAGYSGADIENLALATRRMSLLHKVDLPEAHLLWAIARSDHPGAFMPTLDELRPDERSAIVKRAVALGGVHRTELADIFGTTRQTIHRDLQDNSDERPRTSVKTTTPARSDAAKVPNTTRRVRRRKK